MSPRPRRILRCANRTRPIRPVDQETDYKQMLLVQRMRVCANQAPPEQRRAAEQAYIKLRNAFIEKKLGLAVAAARQYERHDLSQEDLEQVAMEGLIKAADRWEPSHANYGFSTYALFWIRDALQHHLRFNEPLVRVEYSIHRRLAVIEARERTMPPGYLLSDLAKACGLTEAQVEEAKGAPCRVYHGAGLARTRDEFDHRPVVLHELPREPPSQYEENLLLRLDAVRQGFDLANDGEADPPPDRRPSAKLVQSAMQRAKTRRIRARGDQ